MVASHLLAARAIVIGLVPGGPGTVPEVDDLARATGGSVQDTGSSGSQVANAITTALGQIRTGKSGSLTITATPAAVPADGKSSITVTVTIRDIDGNPVAGKAVRIYSTRGSWDILSQPCCFTDINGMATA